MTFDTAGPAESVSPLDRLLHERACERLIMQYAVAVNRWDLDHFVSLFMPDAEWQRPGVPLLKGHAEIRAFMEGQPVARTLRHVNGGCIVTIVDDTSAHALSQTTVYDSPVHDRLPASVPGPDMIVEYADRLQFRDGAWRFARRDTTVVFVGPRTGDQ